MDESVIKHLEQQQQITKLSQTIREGSKLRGQCRGSWMSPDGRSCAWTAAAEATGMYLAYGQVHGATIYNHLHERFPALTPNLFGDVVEGMDTKNWSRTRCAEWLEAQGL